MRFRTTQFIGCETGTENDAKARLDMSWRPKEKPVTASFDAAV
jgi:hypothetical protein